MSELRTIAQRIALSVILLSFLSFANEAAAQDGKALFKANCAACHNIAKDATGPALKDVESRWPSKQLLVTWIKNWNKAVATGDAYAVKIKEWNPGVAMSVFENLSDKDVDAILAYIKTETDALNAAPTTVPGGPGGKTEESDNSLLYGVLTLILAVVSLIMLQVNANLRKLADDKDGVPAAEPIPFYRNKSYITLMTIVLFVIAGYFLSQWAIGMGRQKGYQPDQPIFYSHKVHAGTNQINCLYCHGGAYEGKHANIPSVNVCMNCHNNIKEYGGEKLYKEDGTEVNGTEELKKLFAAAGWDPAQNKYVGQGKPIEWVKIHNLPDHVYFNHSQHTKAGKVQCQTCHGEINKMDEVYQFSELSMGWCVNCHRESKVDFNDEKGGGNKFYSIYEKYHKEIKEKKRDSVTVSDIGGLECQKCHY
ncbi:MAG: c-type cytochrome [Chitinophagaceae bacterium]|uniref:c-type cytochrome n=1 Tax=unclassified Paraflavitalea TaxID=2798305 RepID=UPI003D32CEA4|nr:c-type cytochrome [Chitinophagaceae bacterium]